MTPRMWPTYVGCLIGLVGIGMQVAQVFGDVPGWMPWAGLALAAVGFVIVLRENRRMRRIRGLR